MGDKELYFERYNNRTHLYGRVGLAIGVFLMLGFPFAMGSVLHAMPDMSAFWKGYIPVFLMNFPSCVVEYLLYTPMLGAGGGYLAFITGNILNMKIPCALTARDIVGVEAGTPEQEIVFTLAIATSAMTTTAVVAIGVLLLTPLRPLLESPVLVPAFNNVVPALFGALAFQHFRKDLRIPIIPLLGMSILCVLKPSLIGSVGFLSIPSAAVAMILAWILLYLDNKKEARL